MARRSAAWSHSALLSARAEPAHAHSLSARALSLRVRSLCACLIVDTQDTPVKCPGICRCQGPAPLVYSGPAVDYGVRAPPSTGIYQYINT